VTLKYDDGKPVKGEGVGRKVMKQLYETYASHLAHKVFAYDGEKGLFTVGPLPFKNNVFDVVLCDDASSGKYEVELFESIELIDLLLFWGLVLMINLQDWNKPEPRRRWQSRTK
jgi:hypothetical protein